MVHKGPPVNCRLQQPIRLLWLQELFTPIVTSEGAERLLLSQYTYIMTDSLSLRNTFVISKTWLCLWSQSTGWWWLMTLQHCSPVKGVMFLQLLMCCIQKPVDCGEFSPLWIRWCQGFAWHHLKARAAHAVQTQLPSSASSVMTAAVKMSDITLLSFSVNR